MSWLKDLLGYKKSFCCGEKAEKQRFARKWEPLREVLDEKVAEEADSYILNVPKLPICTQAISGVYLRWPTSTGDLVLYLGGADVNRDYLYSYPEGVYHKPVSISKVREILGLE